MRKFAKKSISFSLLVVCVLAVSLPTFGVPSVKVCALGCEFSTIQAAVDAVDPETVILVKTGVYEENLNIDQAQAITIANNGSGTVSIVGDQWEGPAVTIQDSVNVILYGIHISGGQPGVLVQNSAGITLENVDVQDARTQGVRLVRSVARLNNVFVGNTGKDWHQENGQGIRVENANATISGGSIMDNAHFGILATGTSAILVENANVVGNHVVGIAVTEQSEATLQFNWVSGQKADPVDGRFGRGIESTSSGVLMVLNNQIENNADVGLAAHGGTQMAAFSNTIAGNGTYGVLLTGNADVALAQNRITGNGGPGIYLAQQAVSVILGNFIANNGGAGIGIGFAELNGESINAEMRNNVFHNNAACDVFVDADADIAVRGNNNSLTQAQLHACDRMEKLPRRFAVRGE